MSLCAQMLPLGRLTATACAVAFALNPASRAEQIKFSKPAVEIAVPFKADENVPESRSRRVDFGSPGIAPPVMQQPSYVRVQPRRDDDDDDRLSSRESKPPSDSWRSKDPLRAKPESRNLRNSWPARDNNYKRGKSDETTPFFTREDAQRPLAPVTDFDWDARDSTSSSESSKTRRSSPTDKNDRRKQNEQNALTTRDEYGSPAEDSSFSPFTDMFSARPKEKVSREVSDRRAAFEQMLNSTASIPGRSPGSLEPVAAPRAALAMPAMGGAKVDPKANGPLQAFNMQPDRLRGPMLEDINKMRPGAPGSATPSRIDASYQTPLNRQPTSREFPGRKF